VGEQLKHKAGHDERVDSFRFFHPVEVRYRDVDAQRHVNSAVYFTYLEQARASYLQNVGLWSGQDFDRIGIILAEQTCSYLAPIYYGQSIEVGVRAARIGDKSMHFEYLLRDASTQSILAVAATVLVAYSYEQGESIAVPQSWRQKIKAFEGNTSTTNGGLEADED
jgi:acyl-CoA thioester hydrolase